MGGTSQYTRWTYFHSGSSSSDTDVEETGTLSTMDVWDEWSTLCVSCNCNTNRSENMLPRCRYEKMKSTWIHIGMVISGKIGPSCKLLIRRNGTLTHLYVNWMLRQLLFLRAWPRTRVRGSHVDVHEIQICSWTKIKGTSREDRERYAENDWWDTWLHAKEME